MSNTEIYQSERHPTDTGAHLSKSVGSIHLEATIALDTGSMISLGTLTMISISTHREKYPVTSLSNIRPKGYTHGHRLIAGTLVFSIFQHSAFMSLIAPLDAPLGFGDQASRNKKESTLAFYNMAPDELPPFDIHIVYVNPMGVLCYEGLRGIQIVDEGSVRSIDTPAIQESYSYMAEERIPLQRLIDMQAPALYRTQAINTNVFTKGLANLEAVVDNILPYSLYSQ